MYYGRGEDTESIYSLHAELMENTPDREDAINTMLSKTVLADYLYHGIKRADDAGEDIEGEF